MLLEIGSVVTLEAVLNTLLATVPTVLVDELRTLLSVVGVVTVEAVPNTLLMTAPTVLVVELRTLLTVVVVAVVVVPRVEVTFSTGRSEPPFFEFTLTAP